MAKQLDIGNHFEAALAASFERLSKSHALHWHKLADTGSVTGYGAVAEQPCDFILGAGGKLYMLEAKASVEKIQLGASMMRPSQLRAIHQWHVKLGLPYLVLFYAGGLGKLFAWQGGAVLGEGRLSSKSPGLLLYGADVGHMHSFNENALDAALIMLLTPKDAEDGMSDYLVNAGKFNIPVL